MSARQILLSYRVFAAPAVGIPRYAPEWDHPAMAAILIPSRVPGRELCRVLFEVGPAGSDFFVQGDPPASSPEHRRGLLRHLDPVLARITSQVSGLAEGTLRQDQNGRGSAVLTLDDLHFYNGAELNSTEYGQRHALLHQLVDDLSMPGDAELRISVPPLRVGPDKDDLRNGGWRPGSRCELRLLDAMPDESGWRREVAENGGEDVVGQPTTAPRAPRDWAVCEMCGLDAGTAHQHRP